MSNVPSFEDQVPQVKAKVIERSHVGVKNGKTVRGFIRFNALTRTECPFCDLPLDECKAK